LLIRQARRKADAVASARAAPLLCGVWARAQATAANQQAKLLLDSWSRSRRSRPRRAGVPQRRPADSVIATRSPHLPSLSRFSICPHPARVLVFPFSLLTEVGLNSASTR